MDWWILILFSKLSSTRSVFVVVLKLTQTWLLGVHQAGA